MRALILVAGAALALSACGKKDADDTNTLDVNTVVVDNGAETMDLNAMDMNGMNSAEAMDMNMNDADTNLANGM